VKAVGLSDKTESSVGKTAVNITQSHFLFSRHTKNFMLLAVGSCCRKERKTGKEEETDGEEHRSSHCR